jgi:hypothetical protein
VPVYADIPLTDRVAKAVADRFGIEASPYDAPWLHGGEESAAYRLGDHVVRIGPRWRGERRDADDEAYTRRQVAAFWDLRP